MLFLNLKYFNTMKNIIDEKAALEDLRKYKVNVVNHLSFDKDDF